MSEKIKNTVDAIKELVTLFKMERLVYLIITLISVLVLIAAAISLLIASEERDHTIEIMGLFSSTGGIVYSTGRLLKMWSEAMQLIKNVIGQNE